MLPRIAMALLLGACAMKNAEPPAADKVAVASDKAPSVSVAAKASAPAAKLGEPISGTSVALAAIAKDPTSFADKSVVTTGTVTAVCQAMGCWMEIQDDSGQAHVKMHGHSFFIPKDASGKKARVQAIVEKTNPDEECAQEAEKQTGKPLAKVQLDATGVEIM